MFRKIMSLILSFALIAGLATPAFATEGISSDKTTHNKELESFLTTNEEPVPVLSAKEISTLPRSYETLSTASRANWLNATKKTLEKAYSQTVSRVSETTDYIVFEFTAPEKIRTNFGYIAKVEYVKPESRIANVEYETKITYMYGWMDGYYPLEEQNGTWNVIKDMLITVAGYINQLSVYTFAYTVLDVGYNFFQPTDTVKAANTTQYYVLNKIGQVRHDITGLWLQWAYVGSRRAFYRTIMEVENQYGHWTTVGYKETMPNSMTNPTNPDKTEKKAHFDDNEWIIEKAINSFLYERAYRDVYGMTIYFSENMPT